MKTVSASYKAVDLYRDEYVSLDLYLAVPLKYIFQKERKKPVKMGFESHSRYILRFCSLSKFTANVNKYLVCLIFLWFAGKVD